LELGGMPGEQTLPELAFLALAEQWAAAVGRKAKEAKVPVECDEIALCCLLLAVEYGEHFGDSALGRARFNAGMAIQHTDFYSEYEAMPWRLAEGGMAGGSKKDRSVMELTWSLRHSDGSVRGWTTKLGWLARRWLDPEEATPILLECVASRLGGVHGSWALAVELYPTLEEFLRVAEAFEPESSPIGDQYSDRVAQLKDYGTVACQALLWKMESECRDRIARTAFGESHMPHKALGR
ncbi:MAG: hypothetical protein KF858_11875, partial [Candidatus Sumerlaeia bacterium]|nr:hypothetical protein [Candidatus Sumerlaeia bacterium]